MSDEPKQAAVPVNGAGSYETHAEAEAALPPPPLPGPPERVAELYAACTRFVASKYKVPLDGTPDTLSLLDQYVRDAREAVRERPETIELVAPAIGAYLGEILRHMSWTLAPTAPAEWWAEGDYDGWRLYFKNVYLAFNPIGMAREAITMKEESGWGGYMTLDPGEREEIEARLAAMPEVDEEEYYLPTTRLEVITVVVETLRARSDAAGMGDVTFSKDDYE
jgi:hypothetical protein